MKAYLRARWRSFLFAFRGIKLLLLREPHMKIHFFATLLVIAAGLMIRLSSTEWAIIFIAIGIVCIAEALNTAVEHLCNLYSTEIDERIRVIKDISAGAVLIAAIIAVIIGCFVFVPRLFLL